MRIPQSAVMEMVTGAVMAWPNRAALGVLAYLVQSGYCEKCAGLNERGGGLPL
jgi:hypothetical protein